jgi:hypothetical protein
MDKKEITKRLAFFVLTDASLTLHNGCINASFSLSMCVRNTDILEYVVPAINAIGVGSKYTISKCGKYFRFTTKTHPTLTTMYNRIYIDGRKSPSQHDFKLLDWESMAIMYMCDGNIQKSGNVWYPMLNLCRWNYAELQWVRTQIKEYLSLDMSVYKCGKYFRLGVPRHHVDYFFDNVSQYITPSFSYKLPYGKPQGFLGDNIVRPVGKPTETGGNDLSSVTM